MNCKSCEFLKCSGSANSTRNNWNKEPRKFYKCNNPESVKLPLSAFGNRAQLFVSFGTSEWGSPIALKTSPKWCPLRTITKEI